MGSQQQEVGWRGPRAALPGTQARDPADAPAAWAKPWQKPWFHADLRGEESTRDNQAATPERFVLFVYHPEAALASLFTG